MDKLFHQKIIFKVLSLFGFLILLSTPTIALAANCRDENPKKTGRAFGIKLNQATNWETCWDIDFDLPEVEAAGEDSSYAVKCEKTATIIDEQGFWILNKSNNKPVELIPRKVRSCPDGICSTNSDQSQTCKMDESGKSMTCKNNKYVYYTTALGDIPVDTWSVEWYKYKCTTSDDFF